MNFKDKYSFWIDRKVGDFIYRFHNGEIRRCRADDAARHFQTWTDVPDDHDMRGAWRSICDQSAKEQA